MPEVNEYGRAFRHRVSDWFQKTLPWELLAASAIDPVAELQVAIGRSAAATAAAPAATTATPTTPASAAAAKTSANGDRRTPPRTAGSASAPRPPAQRWQTIGAKPTAPPPKGFPPGPPRSARPAEAAGSAQSEAVIRLGLYALADTAIHEKKPDSAPPASSLPPLSDGSTSASGTVLSPFLHQTKLLW